MKIALFIFLCFLFPIEAGAQTDCCFTSPIVLARHIYSMLIDQQDLRRSEIYPDFATYSLVEKPRIVNDLEESANNSSDIDHKENIKQLLKDVDKDLQNSYDNEIFYWLNLLYEVRLHKMNREILTFDNASYSIGHNIDPKQNFQDFMNIRFYLKYNGKPINFDAGIAWIKNHWALIRLDGHFSKDYSNSPVFLDIMPSSARPEDLMISNKLVEAPSVIKDSCILSPYKFSEDVLKLLNNKTEFGNDSLFYPKERFSILLKKYLQATINKDQARKTTNKVAESETFEAIYGKSMKDVLMHFQSEKEVLHYDRIVKNWDKTLMFFKENKIDLNRVTREDISWCQISNGMQFKSVDGSFEDTQVVISVQIRQNNKVIFLGITGVLIDEQWKLYLVTLFDKTPEPDLEQEK